MNKLLLPTIGLFHNNESGNKKSHLSDFKQETVELMCSNQLTDFQREHSKLIGTAIFREHYGFGLGLAVVLKVSKYGSLPCTGSIGSVGWPGTYGGWWSADPIKKQFPYF